MRDQPIRVLRLEGSPEEMGERHGASYREEIRGYVEDRVARSAEGADRAEVLSLARAMLVAHDRYSPNLAREMRAMADAAGISPEEAMIVGGYTDFIDTVRAAFGRGPIEDNCTAVIVPDGVGATGGFLAQTWDMHASATPHIVMLDLRPDGPPGSLVFSTVGCLGQIGMNEAGICVGINNLAADDGRIGVTWPFVVRRILEQTDIKDALDCVLEADLAGGHNFLLFDSRGEGYSVEAMPTARHVFVLDDEPMIHTNHCLVPSTKAVEATRPDSLVLSSVNRLDSARSLLETRPITVEDLSALTRDESSICRHPQPPHDYESCGAAIMRPATGDFWAVWGVPSENEFEHFEMGETAWASFDM